jgi:WD domain, G-beta repeat
VLISLVSPTYIDRPYCVQHECRRFSELAAGRKLAGQRFAGPEFAADLFALRCPILPMPDRAYWRPDPRRNRPLFLRRRRHRVVPHRLTGVRKSFPRAFAARAHSSAAPHAEPKHSGAALSSPPAPEIQEAHVALTNELSARSYLTLPDNELDPATHVPRCELTARVWNASTGQVIANLEGHTDRVFSAAFSPDGRLVVTASADQTARVWNAATG